MAKSRKTSRDGTRFLLLPHVVIDSPAYLALSFSARALLVDVGRQFSGENNGQLLICDKVLKPRGWKSSATIHKAKQELLDAGFMQETRKGQKPNKASWFAVTWQALDWLPEMDIGRAGFIRGAYLKTDSDPQKMK